MKKLLLNFWLLLLCMIAGAGNAWGDETLTIDFEEELNTNWTLTTLIRKVKTSDVLAHGGNYFGGTNGKESGSVVTNEKIASPKSIVFYVSKESTNNTTSSWLVKVSSDGTNWEQVGEAQSASSGITKGKWTEVSRDLSSYSDVYVGVFYSGTTAKRCIDDVTITYSTGGSELAYNDLALTNTQIALNFDLYNNATAQIINYTTSSTGAVTIDESDYATFAIDTENKTITVTPKAVTPSTQTITVNQEADETYNAGSATFTVTITDSTPLPTYTVTFGDNSSTLTQETAGASVTLPSRDAIGDYTFAGWSETNVPTATTTAPTIIPVGAYTPTTDITLYPVYRMSEQSGEISDEWLEIFEAPADGQYAICSADYFMKASIASKRFENGDATPSINAGKLTVAPSSDCIWEIYKATDNNYRIKYGTNYVAATGSNNQGQFLTDATQDFAKWTITYNNSGYVIENVGMAAANKNRTLRNNDTYGWASYGASTGLAPRLFKKTTAAVETVYYWSSPVAAAVEKPVITVAENPFLFSTSATITCETEGADIKYSYDGENWNDYTAALTITATTTIYAKAVKGNDESSVAQYTATKNLANPTVTVTGDLTLDLDGETDVEAGTLAAAVTYNEEAVEGAVVTWESSNANVATIDAETGAVTIKTTGEVTFTATYAGNSDYAEATGTKTVTVIDSKIPGSEGNPYTVEQARAAIDAGTGITNVYATGKISQIDGYNSTYHSITYWISADGNTIGDQLEVYSGKGLNNANFSAVTDLQVGDVVVVFGTLKKYNDTYEFDKNNYIVSRTELPASDLTKTSDIVLDYKNGATDADLTDCFTTSSTGAITYTIADETVIENAEELISALKVGTTTVTVSQAATLSYKAGEIVISVTVQDTRDAATTIPAINIETVKVDDAGAIEVVNPVKADEGVTFSYTSSNEEVFLIDGTEYAALAVGTATVTVTATPSDANLYKPVVANFEVTVEADVKTDTEIALDTNSGSTVCGTKKSVDFVITDGYDGELTYTIDNAAIADVEIGASAITFTPKAVGTAVITISAPATATFNAAEDVQYTLTVTAPEGEATAAVLGEVTYTFDFSDNTDWAFPTDYATGENTYTKDGKTITLNAASNGYKHLGSALLIGKSGSTLTLPAFDKPVTKITTTGVSGASGKVTQNIFVGETAVSTATTSAAVDHEYEINSEYQAAGTIYTLKVTNGNNTQLTDLIVHMRADITAKLNASGYATFCSQYPLDFTTTDGYTAWQIKAISGETITFEKITGTIKGGQGILLKGDADATVTLASADSDAELNENLLFGTTAPTYIAAEEYYGLSGSKFVKVNAGVVPAGKALLPASEIPSTARELTFVFEDGGTTGIKLIDNSQSTIDNYYDLQGRKVNNPKAGLYIKNGKKVVVK